MTNSQSSRVEVPEAKDAMDKFKMEVANELGVPLKSGYNGDLTSKQAGSVGGEMVRQMIKRQEQEMSGHEKRKAVFRKENGLLVFNKISHLFN